LEHPQHTTPLSNEVLEFVTIIHPCHPLNGQQVEVVRVRRGSDPDLIVRLPDGRHAAVAMSLTSYVRSTDNEQLEARLHLLDLNGLRQIIAFLDTMQMDGCTAEPSQEVRYD
jgi:hypothetical protein